MTLPLDGGSPALLSIALGDGTLTGLAPAGVAVVRTFPDPLAMAASVRVVAWVDRGVAWGTTGGTPFPLTFPQAVPAARGLLGGLEMLYILDGRGLEMFDRLYIFGSPNYAPPFRLVTDVPMTAPVAAAFEGGRVAWIDGSSVWVRP